jgi:hypothetical protein
MEDPEIDDLAHCELKINPSMVCSEIGMSKLQSSTGGNTAIGTGVILYQANR